MCETGAERLNINTMPQALSFGCEEKIRLVRLWFAIGTVCIGVVPAPGQASYLELPMLVRLLLPILLMVASAAKIELQVCQGPFCSKYGCQSVLLAAKLQPGMAGESAACFGKQGCQSAFAQKGVRVRADGLGVRTLKGCENPFTALREVGSIAKQFGV